MKVRAASEQTIPELAERVAELTLRVAELTHRLELSEAVRGNGWRDQQTDILVNDADDSSSRIEFLTENGFSIVRPWETDGLRLPNDGACRFLVSDPQGTEREVKVEISHRLMSETSFHTRCRMEPTSSFWICCAERHLANYVWDHDAFPDGDELIVETLDSEEVILAMRWRRSETDWI